MAVAVGAVVTCGHSSQIPRDAKMQSGAPLMECPRLHGGGGGI
jgi:hypothetical protein